MSAELFSIEKVPSEEVLQVPDANESGEPPAKKPKVEYLWKLVKPKYILTFRLCTDCLRLLYNDKCSNVRHGDRVRVAFDMCNNCVSNNIRATDALEPPKGKIMQ